MSAKATGNSNAISAEALSEPGSSLGLILGIEGPPSLNCEEVMRSLDLQEQKSKEARFWLLPTALTTWAETANSCKNWSMKGVASVRPLLWCGHTSSARVSGFYLGLIRLRSGLGNRDSSARSQDPGMKVPERHLSLPKHSQAVPLSHLQHQGTPPRCPGLRYCRDTSSEAQKLQPICDGLWAWLYVWVRSGSFHLPPPGPEVGGAEAGTGRREDGTQISSRESRDQEDACRAGCWCSGDWGCRCSCTPASCLPVRTGL